MFDLQFAGLMRQFLTYKNVSASKLNAKDLFCFKKGSFCFEGTGTRYHPEDWVHQIKKWCLKFALRIPNKELSTNHNFLQIRT